MTTILTALIDEDNCIGCSKCIRVCPTDAIIGAKRLLHTIIPQFCTSCEECINVCPTNCISLKTPYSTMSKYIENQLKAKKQTRLSIKPMHNTGKQIDAYSVVPAVSRKQSVADAIARVKARKNQ